VRSIGSYGPKALFPCQPSVSPGGLTTGNLHPSPHRPRAIGLADGITLDDPLKQAIAS